MNDRSNSEVEAAFRAGFLAGSSFGMDQASFNRTYHTSAPDENQAWEDHKKSVSAVGGASLKKEGAE